MTVLALPVGDRDHVRGGDGSARTVTLVEYADLECPFCRELEPLLREVLVQRPHVALVYRHFPLVAEHPYAYSAALALEAAAERDRFWPLHDALLADGAPLGRAGITAAAATVGLDPGPLLRPASERHDARVREDFASGVDSGVQGTPALFVQGLRLLRTPTLGQLVDAVDRASA